MTGIDSTNTMLQTTNTSPLTAGALGALLQQVAVTLHKQSDQILQERLGIGLAQFKLLTILEQTPHIEQRTLATQLEQTEASISRQMKLLLEKGMVISYVNPNERRVHLAALTPKGVKLVEAARGVLEGYYQPLFASLGSKEQEQLAASLTSLHDTN